MSTPTNTLSPKSRTNYTENRIKVTEKHKPKTASRYTGTKTTSELRSALCVDSRTSYDIFNR